MVFLKRNGAVALIIGVFLLAIISLLVGNLQNRGGEDISFDPTNFAVETIEIPVVTNDIPHGQPSIAYIESLNKEFYNRFAFSYREMYSAAWIVNALLSMGYTWDDIVVQEFSATSAMPKLPIEFLVSWHVTQALANSPFTNFDMRDSLLSQNVILTVPGQSNKTIIVGAHYDTVMVPGASDNASGTALLLESAQRMREADNYYTIVYVFFGAEEVGLLGSFYYAHSLSQAEHDNILFMINADILLEGPYLFFKAGYDRNGEPGTNHITETWDQISEDLYFTYGLSFIPLPEGVFGPSDQLAFLPWGHTAMFLAGLDVFEGWEDVPFMENLLSFTRVLHTRRDEFGYIEARWPGKIDENMRAFSIFLETILLATYE